MATALRVYMTASLFGLMVETVTYSIPREKQSDFAIAGTGSLDQYREW
jgi:hypothetical protein